MRLRLCLGFYFSAPFLLAAAMTAQLCNGVPYNTSFAICCGGVLSAPKGADNACCGTKPYWTNVTRCCPGDILRPSGWRC